LLVSDYGVCWWWPSRLSSYDSYTTPVTLDGMEVIATISKQRGFGTVWVASLH
jgi:hypothetical protein